MTNLNRWRLSNLYKVGLLEMRRFLRLLPHLSMLLYVSVVTAQSTAPAVTTADIPRLTTELEQATRSGNRSEILRALTPLAELSRKTPDWARWQRRLMWEEFNYGSQSRAITLGEELLAASNAEPVAQTRGAAELAWMYFHSNQVQQGRQTLARAEQLLSKVSETVTRDQRDMLEVLIFIARGAQFWRLGDLDASSKSLREGLIVARRWEAAISESAKGDQKNPVYVDAVGVSQRLAAQLMYALLRQGRTAEALAVAQEWAARFKLESFQPVLSALWNRRLASVLLDQRRFEDALAAARDGAVQLHLFGTEGSGEQALLAGSEEIRALISLQRWQEADAAYAALLENARSDKRSYERAFNALLDAILSAKNGRVEAALKRVEGNMRARARIYGNNHYLTMESRGIRGVVQLISGSVGSALSDYEALFSVMLDSPSGWIDLSPRGLRGYYLEVALDEYLRFVAERYRAGGASAVDSNVFARVAQVTDRIGSGTTQQSIVDSTARLRSGNPGLSDLLEKEQEIRRDLQGIYREIAVVTSENIKKMPEEQRKEVLAKIKELRTAANKTQQQLDGVRNDIAAKFPAYRDLVTPVNPKPEALQKALSKGEAFVSVLPTINGTFVWAINSDGQRSLHVSPWTARDVSAKVTVLRRNLDISASLPSALTSFEFAPFHEIYRELIAPIAPTLKGMHTLVVSAHGPLASVPLGTFISSQSSDLKSAAWLIRDFAITQVPGASAFVAQRRNLARERAQHPLIAYADPDFGGNAAASGSKTRQLAAGSAGKQASTYTTDRGFRYDRIPRLPETREEVAAIAAALGADPARDLILGDRATRRSVLSTDLSNRKVVAFATHGLLPGEVPGVSKPALAMAATADPDDPPLLDLDDVLTLKLNADWVVLSACNTAGGDANDSAMSGLVRGFFFAGSRSVLATHWAVESDASAALVGEIFVSHSKNGSQGRAASLRAAQLAMIDGKIGKGNLAHPFFWSAYALFGDPGR